MDSNKQAMVFNLLEPEIRNVGAEINTSVLENGQSTMSFLTPLYDDGSGLILFELVMLDYQEYTLFQIIATILPEIGKNLPELEKMIPHWNLTSLTGAYGVYYPNDQMYYKNRFLLDEDTDPATIVSMIMGNLYLAYEEIADKYDTAVLIADGKLSYEQAIANKL